MSEILRFPCTIIRIRENIVQVHESGFGPDAKFHNESKGWHIGLSNFAILSCPEKPNFAEGDHVRLTLEKL